MPGVLDPAIGDLDGLGPPPDEVQHRREVGGHPEERVRVVDLARGRLGLAEQLDRGVRVAAPGERHRERRRRVDLLVAGRRAAGAGHLDGVAREPLRIREEPVEHRHLRERGEDRGPLRGRVARDQLDGAPGRGPRPDRVARRAPDHAEALVEQARCGPGRAGRRGPRSPPRGRPSPATSARSRRRPRPPAPGGRRGPSRERRCVAARRRRRVPARSLSERASSSASSSSAAAWRAAAQVRRLDRGASRGRRVVGLEPVPGGRGRHVGRAPPPARRGGASGRAGAGPARRPCRSARGGTRRRRRARPGTRARRPRPAPP